MQEQDINIEMREGSITTNQAVMIGADIAEIPRSERIILMGRFNPKPFAEKIMKKCFFKYDAFKRFWIYDHCSGLWIEDADKYIAYELRKSLFGDEQQKNSYISEVIGYIRDLSWTREVPENIDKNIIAFNNCIYDLSNEKIIPFSNQYFITSKININLDERYKDCKNIDHFFEELLGERKGILYDLMAYCLYRAYPYQKMFILHGSGENGKSTYLDLLIHVLGSQNISTETPQELATREFSKGLLWRKFANISSELPYTSLDDTNTIKGLCGGDTIKCNRKFKEPFQFKSFAKLIFAGNELPVVSDKTHAWGRRLYIIKFENKIKNPIREFLSSILDLGELSGLAWACLDRLKQQKQRGWCFEHDVSASEMMELYEDLSNPLSKFLKEMTESDSDGHIFKFEFRDTFEGWCKGKGFRVWSDTELGKYMKQNYGESKMTSWNGDEPKRYFAWVGIKWKGEKLA